jgi:hypothetical protein
MHAKSIGRYGRERVEELYSWQAIEQQVRDALCGTGKRPAFLTQTLSEGL